MALAEQCEQWQKRPPVLVYFDALTVLKKTDGGVGDIVVYGWPTKIEEPHRVRTIPPDNDRTRSLSRLRQAIIDNTKGEDLFWIGEILLTELAKETGFNG